MSNTYLSVNPCCTEVVLNDPCGCSSTITHTGCNNNPCSTNLTISSSIVYDGPLLNCIVAEPCDTLNVVLQKIDQIICNLLLQISGLNTQVNNLTNQVISINSNITNIFNTLDVCCSVTTTTTTTLLPICENFSLDNTGIDPVAIITTDCITGDIVPIILPAGITNICVQTNSPLEVPGTILVTPNGPCGPTTTTTTTLEPTTTTTTTAFPCDCVTFHNIDIISHTIFYLQCDNNSSRDIILTPGEILQVCGCCGLADDPKVIISVGSACIDEVCPVPTTTTTTTQPDCNCYETIVSIPLEVLELTDNNNVVVTYSNCLGTPYNINFNVPGSYAIGCVDYLVGITATGIVDGIDNVFYIPLSIGQACCTIPITTTTTTTLI
jgi:hypothetical protein